MNAHPTPFPVTLPVARYRLHGRVQRHVAFTDFAGSALRGAFGHALRRAVCVTGQPTCAGCPLLLHCAYPAIFEPPHQPGQRSRQQAPVPYVIEPPAPGALTLEVGEAFDFELVLFGPALSHLGLILQAWQTALARDIGMQGQVQLAHVTLDDGSPVFDATNGALRPHLQTLTLPPPPPQLDRATLHFDTPLSLTRNGKPISPADITAADLLMVLVRRCADVVESCGLDHGIRFDAMKQAAATVACQTTLQARQWNRYSSRQQRSMPVGGLAGSWQLQGNLLPFWPCLQLGQWLHMGKKASFGLGRYRL